MSLSAFFARELAPSHRRIIEAARTATKAMLTAGLAAIMQVVGPFGPLFAFRIGQPGISFGFLEGAVAIGCAASMQAAIVPITGKMLDYPGLILAFLFAVFATLGYLLSNTRLFLPLALVAIGTITTVYVGIFQPGQIGWGSTYTFDGILVATLVMVAIDTFIWPSPPEPRLLESIAADVARTRKRLELVGRRYLSPLSDALPSQPVTSRLAPNLALLKSVEEHMKPTPQRLAVLLDAIVTSERLYLEVEHLAVLADEPASHEIRERHGKEIEKTIEAFNNALAERIDYILAGLPDADNFPQSGFHFRDTLLRLTEAAADISRTADESAAKESLNFLGFIGALEAIAQLLEPREHPSGHTAEEPTQAEEDFEPRPFIDAARFRFSIKLGATITLGLLVGLTTQRADLQTILWSIGVAGQPNQYGAVVRKTVLRLVGCIMGGLAALAVMLIVSQNFDSLPPYLVAIFAVTMFSTYVSQSSEWLGYAGIQTGITFLICYVGLAPSSDVYRPLWRFWGIILGVLTTGFVFLFLWPEYASNKVIESLIELIETTLGFAEEVAEQRITQGHISAVERRLSTNLLQLLNLADQARLEGRRGSDNSVAAIEAATVLIRIAYRFQIIARERLPGSNVTPPQNIRELCTVLERRYCSALECELQKLKSVERSQQSSSTEPTMPAIALAAMNEGIMAEPAEGTDLSAYIHGNLASQIESYRRLPVLLRRLDTALAKIAEY